MPPQPFAHSDAVHQRRHGPCGYTSYEGYKPWLRDDFTFRCVYCLERELWYPDRSASFSVDHVVPQSEAPALISEYTNLVYSCTRCNSARREVRVLDPTEVAFGAHLRLSDNALFEALTTEGQDLLDLLHLNQNPSLQVRRHYLRILALKGEYPLDSTVDQLYLDAFRYPEDMPDLRTCRPPGGNARTRSEDTCYYTLREKGELGKTY